MNRGEIWWRVSFEPTVGGEIRRKRPAVIVGNDISNRYLNRLQVVPLTSKVQRRYPSEAQLNVKGKPNKAMADHLTTVSKLRLINRIARVSSKDMQKIEHALRVQLGLTEPI